MRTGQQFPFKQQVTSVPWGHPSLSAVALLIGSSPADASYVASMEPARQRLAALGARLELVPETFGLSESTLVVLDGYGEVFASFPGEARSSWPSADDLVEWLTFVASQCPECSPAEPAWRELSRD